MESFIFQTKLKDTSLCDLLIDYFKNDIEHKNRGVTAAGADKGKVSTDVTVSVANQNPVLRMYMEEVYSAITEYGRNYRFPPAFKVGLKESWNIQHYAPNEGFFDWHCERSSYQSHQRAMVFMTYLNDVTDAGETEWYYQKLKVKPEKGKTVLWPTDFTHLHRGITSPTQEKYICTGWFNFFDAVDIEKQYASK
tara:strand:- start:209 stop:790 length:582 start_codon:yes stop_codon:yes gene_type:complete